MLSLFKKRKVDHRRKLQDVLGDYELPSFSGVVMSTLEMIRDANSSNADISDRLASDPGLSVRLLGSVNSAACALRHKVSSVHHAVSLLGRGQVESILISAAVNQALPHQTARGFDADRFWNTCALRASAASALAQRIDPGTRSESFTAALLQDMALPVLACRKETEYGPLLERWHAGEDDLAELEREQFGWDHAEVATWMCNEWGFPEGLTAAIGAHHGTDGEGKNGLPAVNLVALLREVNHERGFERLADAAGSKHGVEREQVLVLLEESVERAQEIAHLFS